MSSNSLPVTSSYITITNSGPHNNNAEDHFTKTTFAQETLINNGNGVLHQDEKQLSLEQRELEQQKRYEWRKGRLASLENETNHVEEFFNSAQQVHIFFNYLLVSSIANEKFSF